METTITGQVVVVEVQVIQVVPLLLEVMEVSVGVAME
jgi:hypothetical protein